MVDLPDTKVGLLKTMVDLPDTMVNLPDTKVDLPCTIAVRVKVAQVNFFWIWSSPPLILPNILKLLVHKKVPQNFELAWSPPFFTPLLMENNQIKGAFFFWSFP